MLNAVLQHEPPLGIHVIGDVTDWLLFWGSFWGGILTAIIGFITIYSSTRRSYLALQIEQRKAYVEELERLIFERNQDINFSEVLSIALLASGGSIQIEDLKQSLYRINSLFNRTINNANIWGLLHGNDSDPLMKTFSQDYLKGIDYYKKLCDEMTIFLVEELNAHNNPQYSKEVLAEQFPLRLNSLIAKHRKETEYFYTDFYQAGKNLLAKEREKLQGMIERQNKLFP